LPKLIYKPGTIFIRFLKRKLIKQFLFEICQQN
jgi:hypothetical protein